MSPSSSIVSKNLGLKLGNCVRHIRQKADLRNTQKIATLSSLSWRLGFFFQAEDGIRDTSVTGVQTCALPIYFSSRLVGKGLRYACCVSRLVYWMDGMALDNLGRVLRKTEKMAGLQGFSAID